MTRRLADAVERKARSAVQQQSASWMLASVTAVGTDGTVDITTATGPVVGVRRLRSYAAPQVGDVVKVARNPAGNWVVVDATASSADAWQPLTLSAGFTWTGVAGDPVPSAAKDALGMVVLSGMITPTGLSTSTSTVFATLPAGIRPQWRGACLTVGDAASVRIYINTGGSISARLVVGNAPTWISLDGARCR
ncbi:hypothetical protein [Streptomyces sparsogenes]|uniref:hypothetical protein n=1 Tax=Streptomyces sparsogenes TaxID=67365 RepID=UPI0033F0886B